MFELHRDDVVGGCNTYWSQAVFNWARGDSSAPLEPPRMALTEEEQAAKRDAKRVQQATKRTAKRAAKRAAKRVQPEKPQVYVLLTPDERLAKRAALPEHLRLGVTLAGMRELL